METKKPPDGGISRECRSIAASSSLAAVLMDFGI